MKEIQLTQGQVAKVDDWWYDYLMQWKWFAWWNKHTKSFYARRNNGSNSVTISRIVANTPRGMVCDHINHDTLDNQIANLRNVTYTQNQINRRGAQSDNILGVLGVSPHGNGFRAHIKINKKSLHFPTREKIEDAIEDRKEAEKQYYGKFAFK